MNIEADKWYVIKPTGDATFSVYETASPTYAGAVNLAESNGTTSKSVISGAELLSLGFD